ncbi:MAG: class I SAM-dependent methyltransferase, partial [Prochlorothrix sp.]
PHGVIRANLHSSLQRQAYFRLQGIFQEIGLFQDNPEDPEMLTAVEFVASLKHSVEIKQRVFPSFLQAAHKKEFILMNYLFQGDTGYRIPELFAMLKVAGLEFINMVNWRQWNFLDLFQSQPPSAVIKHLAQMSIEDYLSFYERLNPVHRLLDFWCCSAETAPPLQMVSQWSPYQWERSRVWLHPQLNRPDVKQALIKSLQTLQPFPLTPHLPLSEEQIVLDCVLAAALLPLFEGGQSIWTIVQRLQQTNMVDLVSLQVNSAQQAFQIVQEALTKLEHSGYILLTTPD